MDKEKAREEIEKLVSKYKRVVEEKKLSSYKEEPTKKDFILPLFRVLGWNVEDSNEVTAEETISKKRVDYGFRINGIPKFFLEAKALKEDLDNIKYVEQAINYSWHKGCTWAVLTNFESIKIYNAEWKTGIWQSHLKTITCDQFLDRFDELWLLSKESFEQGLLDKEAEKWGKKTKKTSVDKQLLNDFTRFREMLSKNIAKVNPEKKLTQQELDEAVQRMLDRLIFIRSCEDRELEEKLLLARLRDWKSRGGQLIKSLREVFDYFDKEYNSEIFKESLADQVHVDNDVLQEVIEGLYYTKDGSISYDFSAIEADVLGNIYEQYLGHILKKTEKSAKLTKVKTHRKEQGIYYTPTYIVDYIVQNTLGELLKDKKVDASKIRVLDPACGSGSFLIKAFDVLNEYYKNKDKNYEQTKLGKDALPYSKKLEILQNNIFGVDLDKQAVEIAQLNLLLKVAEKGKRLPLLKKNIKCGNSLIDDHNVAGDKAFKWEEEFKEIMDEGGFDVVIGNPPYFTMQSTGIKIQSYFSSSSRWKDVYRGQSDILYYFIIQGLRLLKNGGFLGFITSRYWLENKWSDKLREFILNNTKITKIIDFRDFYIFSDANIHTCIIIIQKENNNLKRINNQIKYKNLKNKINDIYKFLHSNESNSIKQGELKAENIWVFDENKNIIKKIEQNSIKLGELCFVSKGMDTGFNKAFIIDEKIIQNENIEKQILKRVLKNSDISRYFIKDSKLYLIYTTNDVKIENFKNTKKWLEKFKKELTNRWEYRRGGCTWFRISTLRSKNLFDSAKEKIYTPYRSSKNNFALDDKNFYGMTDTTIIVNKKESTSLKYLLGILNSKLMNFYVIVTGKKKGTSYEYFADYLKQIPIKLCSEKDEKLVIENVKKIITLFNKLNEIGDKKTDERAKIEEEIKKTDAEIDELVYKIYGITEEEKKIIEESLEGN